MEVWCERDKEGGGMEREKAGDRKTDRTRAGAKRDRRGSGQSVSESERRLFYCALLAIRSYVYGLLDV